MAVGLGVGRSAATSSTRIALAERVFIDTNVLLYADDLNADGKVGMLSESPDRDRQWSSVTVDDLSFTNGSRN